jgi:tetratricopeptide (TPR) repeat protein
MGTGSMQSLVTLNNESVDLVNFGELRAATATSAEVLKRLAERGAGAATQVPFRTNYGARLAALGRYPEALTYLDRAIADGRASQNQYWQQRAQFFRACALVHAGRRAEAKAALDEIEQDYRVDPIKNAASLQLLTVCRGDWQLSGGDVAGARATIEDLLRQVGYPGQTSLPMLRSALPAAAKVALADHDAAAAQAYARAALAYARKEARDPNQSADYGRALVLLAQAQQARGNEAAAAQTLTQALPALSGGLGADHPEVADARTRLATLSREPTDGPRPVPTKPPTPAVRVPVRVG